MKNIFLFCVAGFFLFSCKDIKEKKGKAGENSPADFGFKGNVKIVTLYSYSASGDSGKVIKGHLVQTANWIFDEKGYCTEWNIKDSNDTKITRFIWKYDSCEHLVTDSEGTFVTKFQYNKAGNRTGTIQYSWDSGKCKTEITEIYKVDDKGNRIEEDSYSGNLGSPYKKEFIKNNDQGKEIERTRYDDKGKLAGKEIRVLDAKGNQIGYRSYIDGKLFLESTYIYDTAGHEIENGVFKEGKFESHRKRKYDDKGNVVDYEQIWTRGNDISRYHYHYENFDKQGNWLRCTILNDGKPSTFEEQAIEYYP